MEKNIEEIINVSDYLYKNKLFHYLRTIKNVFQYIIKKISVTLKINFI